MSNLPVDRNSDYMKSMWGTTKLITDYNECDEVPQKRVIQEIMHDDLHPKKHNLIEQLIEQTNLHKNIRNDDDYDDWEYGTEPTYGSL